MEISPAPAAVAVAFDFGQTLCDLDTAFLARRLAERGLSVSAGILDAAMDQAWGVYNASIASGAGKGQPWRELMRALVRHGEPKPPPAALESLIDWLWSEQPRKNLWRRPVPGMLELVRSLGGGAAARAAHAGDGRPSPVASPPVALISNSEGHIAALAAEVGLAGAFDVIADSFLVGADKPDPLIFRWTAERLGVPLDRLVYVGDSFSADGQGALGAGCRAAIWFRGRPDAAAGDRRILCAQDASEVRAALQRLGVAAPAFR